MLTAFDAGAKGDSASPGSGTDDTASLQSLLDTAAGKHCYIPPAPGGAFRITDRLSVHAGTYIEIHPGAVIRQDTKWKPCFDVYDAPDVTIRGGELRWEGTRNISDQTGTFRAEPGRDYFAGVWTNSHRTRINTRCYGMFCAVTVSGYDTTANNWQSYHTKDCVIERLEFENCSMGILCGGYDRLKVGVVQGQVEDFTPVGLREPSWIAGHTIYSSDNGSFSARGLDVDTLVAYDSINCRQMFQPKRLTNSHIGKMLLRNTQGPIGWGNDVSDITVGEIHSYDDNGDSLVGGGSIQFFDTTVQRITIEMAYIHMKAAKRAVGAGGIDNTINQLVISQDPSVDFAGRQTAIQDASTSVRFHIGSLRYIGRSSAASGHTNVCHTGGTDFTVLDASAVNQNQTFGLLSTAVNTKISYDPQRMSPSPNATDARKLLIKTTYPTNPKVTLKPSRKAYSTTGGATVTPAFGDQSIVALSINATNAFTINAPTDAVPGTDLTFELFNNSGRTVGTITWNTVYKFHNGGAAVTAPTAGNRKSVTFHYDGTNWVERHRSG